MTQGCLSFSRCSGQQSIVVVVVEVLVVVEKADLPAGCGDGLTGTSRGACERGSARRGERNQKMGKWGNGLYTCRNG